MKLIIYLSFIALSVHGKIIYGNAQFKDYQKFIKDKKIALVVNQASKVKDQHLIDYLIERNINITKIFALEHGVRGEAPNGDTIEDSVDERTGIPIISLYGKKKKPSSEDLRNIDIILYDIQDVGVRFFTYIASLGNIMEAVNNESIELIILDRPNPNNYVAGPVNDHQHFLAPYPIPIVYGLTIGELALMIKGEEWRNVKNSKLRVIALKNYNRSDSFNFETFPSPNLRSLKAINNYPTLALFEGVNISIGRGTYRPFEILGFPKNKIKNILFTPKSLPQLSLSPKFEGKTCLGEEIDLGSTFNINLLLKYLGFKDRKVIHKNLFKYLIGDIETYKAILARSTSVDFPKLWKSDIESYRKKRKNYLIYKE